MATADQPVQNGVRLEILRDFSGFLRQRFRGQRLEEGHFLTHQFVRLTDEMCQTLFSFGLVIQVTRVQLDHANELDRTTALLQTRGRVGRDETAE